MNVINQDQLIELFCELVEIDSPTGSEAEISRWVTGALEGLSLSPVVDEHKNVFVRIPGEGEPVFMAAHLDTVEPGREIMPQVEDGWLVSQGNTILGADNKVAVAALLTMIHKLVEDSGMDNRPVEVLFTTSEEIGNYGALGFDFSQLKAREGFVFDSSHPVGTVISASPFYARFDVTILGEPAHAGYPELAKPALPVMLELLPKIESLRSDNLLVTIGKIHGGEARNTVIGELTLNGELRSFDKDVFESGIERLDSLFSEQHSLPLKSEVVVENPGYRHSSSDVEIMVSRVGSILGEEVESVESFGVSDANIYNTHYDNLKVFNLGDATVDSHTTDERIRVDDLVKLTNLTISLATERVG